MQLPGKTTFIDSVLSDKEPAEKPTTHKKC